MSVWLILLAGLAVSLLMEGLLFLAAPGFMRGALKTLSEQSERELALSGGVSAVIGLGLLGLIFYMA